MTLKQSPRSQEIADYVKASVTLNNAYVTYFKARAVYDKACSVIIKAYAVYDKARATYDKSIKD